MNSGFQLALTFFGFGFIGIIVAFMMAIANLKEEVVGAFLVGGVISFIVAILFAIAGVWL